MNRSRRLQQANDAKRQIGSSKARSHKQRLSTKLADGDIVSFVKASAGG